MSTSEPGPFTERGDRAEAAAYQGDGVYSGGQFAGAEPERYERLSGTDLDAGSGGNGAPNQHPDEERARHTDVESRDLQHTSLERNATGTGPHSDRR